MAFGYRQRVGWPFLLVTAAPFVPMVLQWKALAPSVLGLPLSKGGPGGWFPEFTAITGKALSAITKAMTTAAANNITIRFINAPSLVGRRDSSEPHPKLYKAIRLSSMSY
jgi:hypothetical protein